MVGRILIEGGPAQVLISKPGHEVTDPSLVDDHKIFDSSWFFTGQIVLLEKVTMGPFPPNTGLHTHDVMFPKQIDYPLHWMIFGSGGIVGNDGYGEFIRSGLPWAPLTTPPTIYNQGLRVQMMSDRARCMQFAPVANVTAPAFTFVVFAMGAA